MKADNKFRYTAKEVMDILKVGKKIEVGDFENYDSIVRKAAIVSSLDGMSYEAACSLLEHCKYVIKATTIQADKILV